MPESLQKDVLTWLYALLFIVRLQAGRAAGGRLTDSGILICRVFTAPGIDIPGIPVSCHDGRRVTAKWYDCLL